MSTIKDFRRDTPPMTAQAESAARRGCWRRHGNRRGGTHRGSAGDSAGGSRSRARWP